MRLAAAVGVVALFLCARPAVARTHQASVGNYYYEEDAEKDRTRITVRQGDQITFTVRDPAYPPHTVDVDALGIHSPDLLLGETYTTPPLRRAGSFYLYCRPHEARGHHTRLVVLAAATAKEQPAATEAPPQQHTTGTAPPASVEPAATPSSTLSPIGLGKASPGVLERPIRPNPDSVEALTGRYRAGGPPWTAELWWLAVACVPILAAAGYAFRRAVLADHAAAAATAGPKPRTRAAPPPKGGARRKPAP